MAAARETLLRRRRILVARREDGPPSARLGTTGAEIDTELSTSTQKNVPPVIGEIEPLLRGEAANASIGNNAQLRKVGQVNLR